MSIIYNSMKWKIDFICVLLSLSAGARGTGSRKDTRAEIFAWLAIFLIEVRKEAKVAGTWRVSDRNLQLVVVDVNIC